MLVDILKQYCAGYDLVIFDINGVLDNNHDAKVAMLSAEFPEMSDLLISKVNIDMERAYEKSQSGSTASHIQIALGDNGIVIDDAKANVLSNTYYDLNRIHPELIDFLNELSQVKKVCLYTSLSREKVDFITSRGTLSPDILFFSREEQVESKPSIRNLERILDITGVPADKAILFGDNVAVDIMPAHLLGIKSILTSNYVDGFIKL